MKASNKALEYRPPQLEKPRLRGMKVYNPDDEPLEYRFAGSPLKFLAPQTITELPENEGRFLCEGFGKFGITEIPNGDDEQSLIADIEKRYVEGTRKWAEEVLVEWHDKTRSQRELKIVLDEPKAVVIARGWLHKHGFMEK